MSIFWPLYSTGHCDRKLLKVFMVDIRVQGVMWQQRQASAIITDSSRGLEFGTKEKKKPTKKVIH